MAHLYVWTSFPPFRQRRVKSPCTASNCSDPTWKRSRPLRSVASEASIPYRTALRWASRYRKDGLAALARRSRTDQGGRRLASTTLIKAIEGLALERPPLPDQFHTPAGERDGRDSSKSASLATRLFGGSSAAFPASLLMLAHRGNKAYSEGFDLVHRREASKPNSIWQVDHAQLDIKLLRDDGSVGKALADDCHR